MSTFTEASHPRADTGRFTPAAHTEPSLALPAAAISTEPAPDLHLARRYEAASWVLADYSDLEIMDHSPARQTTVTLGQLGDPRLALGNCWAATNEVIEEAGASAFGAEWVDEITISRKIGGQHVAILVADADGMYVVDYTARQFSPDLPFPYVAGVKDWMESVAKASGHTWILDED
ncbi:MAG TPA: hypothetical protein VF867_19990 [Arthrobacter sp.]